MKAQAMAGYVRHMEQTEAPHELVALSRELTALPIDPDRDTLLRMIRAMLVRRAVEN